MAIAIPEKFAMGRMPTTGSEPGSELRRRQKKLTWPKTQELHRDADLDGRQALVRS
jgi:hypothetical protein